MKLILVCLCLFTPAHALPKEDKGTHINAAMHQLEDVYVANLQTDVLNLHHKKHQNEPAVKNMENIIQEKSEKDAMPNSRDKLHVDCHIASGIQNLQNVDADIILGCDTEGSGNSDFLDKSHKGTELDATYGVFSPESTGSTDTPFPLKDVNNDRSKDMHSDPGGMNKVQSPKKSEHSSTSHNPNGLKKDTDRDHHDMDSTHDTNLLNIDEEDGGSGNSNSRTEGNDSTVVLDKTEDTTVNPGFTTPEIVQSGKVHWNSSGDIQETVYSGVLEKDEDNTSTSNGTADWDNLKTIYTETSGIQEYTDRVNERKNNSKIESADYTDIRGKDQLNATVSVENPLHKNISNKNKHQGRSKSSQNNHINDINNKKKNQKGHFHTVTTNGEVVKVKNNRKAADRIYNNTVRQKINKRLRKKKFHNDSSQSSGSSSESSQSTESRSNSDQSD
ncbi:transcription initiation factor TFIID subunit 1 [Microcaecilia unicolor]|uniref:Transcription initiation factor TFIID subunit 1-like n=1 Tax=Microcaecilia unicolor TaxID=1415580 RepID=A0A6P7XDW2_9AMPH|nr:transcription initiation factor TFIID subunit 1-like [Microcaecilia unicolor]